MTKHLCKIAVDAMGGDHGPAVVVPAALDFLAERANVELILVGQPEAIEPLLVRAPRERLRVHPASQVVGMDEPPSKALKNKKDSSMRVAINLVKDGQADACVSAGNTGALMATARFVLKTLPLIDRPGIVTAVPSLHGHTYMLDLGANVDCSAEHLFQFAVMGSELVSAVDGIERPRVALLNVGEEEIKGNEQVKRAHELLINSGLNYVGYAEGDAVYLSDVEVVVTDGFVGNVALKTSEGVARFIRDSLTRRFKRSLWTRLAALVAFPVLRAFKNDVDPRRYNGASLVGLRGVVIKSHGGADRFSFKNALLIAEKESYANIPQRIGEQVGYHLGQGLYRESA